MIKKQNLDRILLRITIISDRFNILGKKKKKTAPIDHKTAANVWL